MIKLIIIAEVDGKKKFKTETPEMTNEEFDSMVANRKGVWDTIECLHKLIYTKLYGETTEEALRRQGRTLLASSDPKSFSEETLAKHGGA